MTRKKKDDFATKRNEDLGCWEGSDEEGFFYREWCDDEGYLHREGDKPAIEVSYDYGGALQEATWYHHGQMHRKGKPAHIYSVGVYQEMWALHGEEHRIGAPSTVIWNASYPYFSWKVKGKDVPALYSDDVTKRIIGSVGILEFSRYGHYWGFLYILLGESVFEIKNTPSIGLSLPPDEISW